MEHNRTEPFVSLAFCQDALTLAGENTRNGRRYDPTALPSYLGRFIHFLGSAFGTDLRNSGTWRVPCNDTVAILALVRLTWKSGTNLKQSTPTC
jgi:hypothetical protein